MLIGYQATGQDVYNRNNWIDSCEDDEDSKVPLCLPEEVRAGTSQVYATPAPSAEEDLKVRLTASPQAFRL